MTVQEIERHINELKSHTEQRKKHIENLRAKRANIVINEGCDNTAIKDIDRQIDNLIRKIDNAPAELSLLEENLANEQKHIAQEKRDKLIEQQEKIAEDLMKLSHEFIETLQKANDKAIAEHLPDEKARKEIDKDINALNRQLTKLEREKDNIVTKLFDGDNKLNDSIIEAANKKVEQIDKSVETVRRELAQQEQRRACMMSVEEYQATADKIRAQWQRVYTGWDAMEDMTWQNKKYLVDQMFDGVDETGRPFGVYVRNVGVKVFEYEIFGRFTTGTLFMKGENSDYDGKELKPIYEQWNKDFQERKAAYHKKHRKSKSCNLKMGDTGLEPVTPCV